MAFDDSTLAADWTSVVATELYDLTADDGRDFDFEGYSHNVVAAHKDEVATLLKDLEAEVKTWR